MGMWVLTEGGSLVNLDQTFKIVFAKKRKGVIAFGKRQTNKGARLEYYRVSCRKKGDSSDKPDQHFALGVWIE